MNPVTNMGVTFIFLENVGLHSTTRGMHVVYAYLDRFSVYYYLSPKN